MLPVSNIAAKSQNRSRELRHPTLGDSEGAVVKSFHSLNSQVLWGAGYALPPLAGVAGMENKEHFVYAFHEQLTGTLLSLPLPGYR